MRPSRSQPQGELWSTGEQSRKSQPMAQIEASAGSPLPPKFLRGAIKLRACVECRKKRTKCDGERPCGRCQAHGISVCRDDVAVRQSKEELRTVLKNLRERQDSIDQLLSAVVEPELSSEILERLSAGQSLDAILGWVEDARSSTSISPSGSAPSGSTLSALSDHVSQEATNQLSYTQGSGDMPPFPGLEQVLWPQGAPTTAPSPEAWTDISDNTILTHHLLALYFCWEYPVFAPLSRVHFMIDFHEGRHRYCSPLLVNSLLALGSRWSTRPNSRANLNNGNSSGDSFFAESVRLLNQETDRRSLTTVQALGLMSMREISCGRDAEGRYYSTQAIQLAIDMGLHRKVDDGDLDLLYVQASTFWGAFSLDTVLSTATGSLPQYPYLSPLPPKPFVLSDIEESPWMPYTDDAVPRQIPHKQKSNAISTYNCFCQLTETMHGTLYALHSPVSSLTGEDLLSAYTSYLNWYDQMPEALRRGFNSTPFVLFSHMSYHFAIIHLFRPFLDLQILGSDISPGHICHQAADAIQGLLRSYSQLYTLHRTPALFPCLVLASAASHLDKRTINTPAPPFDTDTEMTTVGIADQHIFDALDQDISDLGEMAACHSSAEQALGLIGSLANALKVGVDIDKAAFSAKDYDRLARPYMRRSKLEAHVVESNGFLIMEHRATVYLSRTRSLDYYNEIGAPVPDVALE